MNQRFTIVVFALLASALPRHPALAATHPIEEINFAREELTVERAGPSLDEVVVRYPGAIAGPEGAPDLARVLVWVEIPAGMRAVAVAAEPVGIEELGRVWVRPVSPDVRPGDEVREAVADPAIYESGGTYPAAWAELGPQGSMRGHRVVPVLVSPVRWDISTGRLVRASAVRLALELESGEAGDVVARHRVVREIEQKFEAAAGRTIRGFEPAAVTGTLGVSGGSSLVGDGPAGPGPFQPTFRPTTDGSAVEYVIVSSDELAGEFERLAEWKTQKGVQSAVRTVEWIDQTYPNGVDRAERIRFFIRDAYQNWGTLYVLLGGDTDVVPPRYAQMVFLGEEIPTDYYYACLDGNWNADGDSRFAESLHSPPGDQCDFYFEVSIGRAPASTITEAATFVDKVILYDKEPPDLARYPASILVLAERLFDTPTGHGADIAEMALDIVPSWFNVVRLYEESASYPGSIELTRQSAIDSINAGFGLVHHVGHGYRNSMSVGDGTLSNGDADDLINAPRNSVVFAINCSSASIDFNSIGERWVKNPNGGSIAYLGTSRLAFVGASRTFQNEWYANVFGDSVTARLGLATDLSRLILVPQSLFDSQQRWNLLATTLLGDPDVDLYTNDIIPIQVAHPETVAVGSDSVTVTVTAGGSPVDSAAVTLFREGEVYVRAETAADGTAELPITADTEGALILTVHRKYYRVYADTLAVTAASGPYVHVDSVAVDDDGSGSSSGDGDGLADAGETIELTIRLKNGGALDVTALNVVLTAEDPENALTIIQDTVAYGTLTPGGTSEGSGPFVIAIDPAAPVAYQPVLSITAIGNEGGPWEDRIALPIRRPYLEHYEHQVDDAAPRGNGDGVVDPGEEIIYRVTLRNSGQDEAAAVEGKIRALEVSTLGPHPLVTVGDSLSSFGSIATGATAPGDSFAFTLDGGADPATLLLELTLSDGLGVADLELLDVLAPEAPETLTAFGSPASIRLQWQPPAATDVKGYDILRAPDPGGPFARINTYTVDGTAAYEDPGLPAFTRYYYKVVARDSSYNVSVPSEVISGSTNPPLAAGWPQPLGAQSSSSPVVADIDGGDHNEILFGAEMQYAFHGDGTELLDGDDNDRTNGPFSLYGKGVSPIGFSATPALGNIDGLGDSLQVINSGFFRDSLYVWNTDGELMPGWPKRALGDGNWGSPLVADLDLDGDLEVVLWAGNGGRLFAWHHDGVELVDGDQNPATDGVLVQVADSPQYTFNYSSPAVGNLDQDPELEIVFAFNVSPDNSGGVYATNIDGTPVAGGWPFFTGDAQHPSQVTSSLAIADLDGDGDEEVIFACERNGGSLYALNGDASIVAGAWPNLVASETVQSRVPSPSIADLDGDMSLDIIYPSTDGILYAFSRVGTTLSGFPTTYYPDPETQTSQSTASIGDIDGDGRLEIVFGDVSGKIHAYNHDGTEAAGFPIQLNGEVHSTPALWDIDLDFDLELVTVCFDGNVYAWELTGGFDVRRLPWPFFRHDPMNTGRFSTPIPSGPTAVIDPGPGLAPVPQVARFHAARPNPFNPHTTLAFEVPGEANGARLVSLAVYDVSGRLVRRLVNGPVETGRHEVVWDGRGPDGRLSASGVYLARIQIGTYAATQKLTMIR